MKKLFTLIGALAAISQAGWGATVCVPGTLATYVALGSTGCSIGTDTLSNFHTINGITGAAVLQTSALTVTPSGTAAAPTLTFSTSSSTTALLESIFSYRILASSFSGSMITLSNTSGDGTATYIQNLCGNGNFGLDGVSGCTGTTAGPLVAVSSGSDVASFSAPSFLTVTDDFTLDAGGATSSSGGTFVDRFTASPVVSSVPEPGTIAITALGTALLFTLKRRSKETL